MGHVTGMTRCMMATAGVSKQFWHFALSTAMYLRNRSILSALGPLLRCFTEAANQKESEDDDASQSDVDDLKLG